MSLIKSIEVTVDRNYGTKQLLRGLVSVPAWRCHVLPCLLVTGYLTTPPRHRPLSLSTYWAWLRYGAAISRRDPGLRLCRAWTDLDPHQKTILADDFGVGFPSLFLIEQHGFEDYADTSHLLDTLLKGSATHKKKSKRGPAKTPDFIALDSAGNLHVLECKGTQTTRAYLRKSVTAGQAQKRNIVSKPRGLFKSCMVGGIFIPQCDSKEDAELLFIDPEPDPRIRQLEDLPETTVAAAVRRHSLAKGLAMCGLWGSATAIDGGELAPHEVARVLELEKGELGFNGFVEFDLGWRRSIEYRAIDNVVDEGGAFVTRLTIDVPRALTDLIKQVTSTNGERVSDLVENWLLNQAEMRQRDKGGDTIRSPGEAGTSERLPQSSWTFDHDADDDTRSLAAITLPSGLRFMLSLEQVG